MATNVLQSRTRSEQATATWTEGEHTKGNSSNVHNPYLAARKEWDERYGDLISRARNWRAAAFLFGVIALASVAGIVAIAKQARVVPYVVAVDSLGRVASVGMAETASIADDRLKRAAIYQWVSDWRIVTIDGIAQ